MGRLTKALGALNDVAAGKELVAELIAWTTGDVLIATMIATLGNAAAARRAKTLQIDTGCIAASTLFRALNKIHTDTLQKFRDDESYEVDDDEYSHFRHGRLEPRSAALPLLFLIWLSEQMEKKTPRFGPDSQVTKLMAVFNPVLHVEQRILRGAPLPPLSLTPSVPLLPGRTLRRPRKPGEPLDPEELLELEQQISNGLVKLLALEDLASDQVENDFFRRGQEKTCFLIYRRSIEEGEIIKGFLVIQRPRPEGGVGFSFSHFYEDSRRDFRKTRGLVVTLRDAHYFLGGTAKADRTDGWDENTPSEPRQPSQAIKAIVVARDSGIDNGNVWGGLFLSSAQGFEPIAGRCVLVRAKHATYQASDVFPIKIDELDADLKKFGADSFASMEAAFYGKLVDGIRHAINNGHEPLGIIEGPLKIVTPL